MLPEVACQREWPLLPNSGFVRLIRATVEGLIEFFPEDAVSLERSKSARFLQSHSLSLRMWMGRAVCAHVKLPSAAAVRNGEHY